jgi:hypothetical protein
MTGFNSKRMMAREVGQSRLEALMIESGYAYPEGAGRAHKLAELIIQECCDIVLSCSIPGSNNERDFIVASREIKHHFGVEE